MKLQNIKLTPTTHFTYFYLDAAKTFYPMMEIVLEDVCEDIKGLEVADTQEPIIDDMKLYHYVKDKINLLHKPQIDEFSACFEIDIHTLTSTLTKEFDAEKKLDFKNLIQIDFYKGIKCFAITVPKSTTKFIQELMMVLNKKLGLAESQMFTGFCSLLINFEAVQKSKAMAQRSGIEKVKRDTRDMREQIDVRDTVGMCSSDSDEICQFLKRYFGADYSLAKPDAMYRLKINSLENFRDKYVAKLNALLDGAIKTDHYSTRDTKYIKIMPEIITIIRQKNKGHQEASEQEAAHRRLADQEILAAQVMMKDKVPMKFR